MAVDRLAFRISEVAEAIGVSRSKAYELVARGDIPSVEIGGCRRVTAEALKTRLAAESTTAERTEAVRR
jgi:excisionase family DNA binding protein